MSTRDPKVYAGPILGVAPSPDGHTRITRGDNLAILGGSEESHAEAREAAVRINEKLDRKGREVSIRELHDIVSEALDR